MPVEYVRSLTAVERTARANLHLGAGLTFVAGATNAGAFLAVGRYTSHMTGVLSEMADAIALGHVVPFVLGLGALGSFVAGAATTALLVNYGRRRGLGSAYSLPLVLEAWLLLLFGLTGATLLQLHAAVVPITLILLCFTMGLQNAVITKLSNAEIRTTHVTGLVTDLGIELGRWLYVNRSRDGVAPVLADRQRLRVLGTLLFTFFAGGFLGAVGFQTIGFLTTVPLAVLLLALTAVPLWDDLRGAASRGRSTH